MQSILFQHTFLVYNNIVYVLICMIHLLFKALKMHMLPLTEMLASWCLHRNPVRQIQVRHKDQPNNFNDSVGIETSYSSTLVKCSNPYTILGLIKWMFHFSMISFTALFCMCCTVQKRKAMLVSSSKTNKESCRTFKITFYLT